MSDADASRGVVSSIDWSAILPGGSVLTLLYGLMIVDRFLHDFTSIPATALTTTQALTAAEWKLSFIVTGGVSYLLKVWHFVCVCVCSLLPLNFANGLIASSVRSLAK